MQVSILCSQVNHAKRLRDALEGQVAVCYVYTNWDEFWNYSQDGLTQLYLLDVELVCGQERGIIDHPKYRARQMNVAFFYSQSTLPLMSAAYRLDSLGDFDVEVEDLPEKLSQILRFLKVRREREAEVRKLKAELYLARQERERSEGQLRELWKQANDRQLLGEVVRKIDRECCRQDFLQALAKVVEELDFFQQYGIFELAGNGQKLVSPRLAGRKYRALPSLQLGQDHGIQGIKQYAQGLAHQVAVDCLGGKELIALGPRMKAGDGPQVLIYCKVENGVLQRLDWNLLQLFLSGFYGRSLLRDWDRSRKSSHLIGQWEFYDLLVDEGGVQENPCHILVLDFQKLIQSVDKKAESDFQWLRFYEEFNTLLDSRIEWDYLATCLGRWGMAFFVAGEYREAMHALLREFSREFAYWRFFDDPDQILVLDLNPQITVLSAYHEEFFRYLADRNLEDAEQYIAQEQREEEALQQLTQTLGGRDF